MKYYKIFFPILVLIALVIPLFHMNTVEITEQENRTLAKFPKMHKKGKLNENYGKEFEAWLGDRFWGRDQLIDARFQALYKINGRIENEKAFIGDDGWMFEKSKTANRPSIKKQREKIEKDAKILKAFADKFKDKNIPIYLVLIPEREVLYQKYWERYYKPKPYLDYGEEIEKLLANNHNVKVFNFGKVLTINRGNYFYKDDVHLNGKGTQLLGLNFLKFLKIDTSTYTVDNNIKNTRYFSIAKQLGIKNVVYEDTEKTLSVSHSSAKYNTLKKLPREMDPFNLYEIGKSTQPVKREKLYLLGICYTKDSLFPFFKYAYKNIERITIWPFNDGKEDLYLYRLEKIKRIYKDKDNISIVIVLSNSPERELKIIEDSLSSTE